jgi:hypothetical protein
MMRPIERGRGLIMKDTKMTAPYKSKPKSKVREFKLNEEFQEKYGDITRI